MDANKYDTLNILTRLKHKESFEPHRGHLLPKDR